LVIKKITLLFFALLSLYPLFAQDYGAVEFVENKGQWDGQVRFAAKAAAGGVFLHNNGFTILQHHPRDWETITEIVHKQQAAKEVILGSPQMRLVACIRV
jgi:hypothetical protein